MTDLPGRKPESKVAVPQDVPSWPKAARNLALAEAKAHSAAVDLRHAVEHAKDSGHIETATKKYIETDLALLDAKNNAAWALEKLKKKK